MANTSWDRISSAYLVLIRSHQS